MQVLPPEVHALIDLALSEDAGRGDVTSESIFSPADRWQGKLVAREALVVAGSSVAQAIFEKRGAEYRSVLDDGERAGAGDVIAEFSGPTIEVLIAERTALNFMQRLAGVATAAAAYVEAVAGTGARVVDTRKTTPGYRWLEKAAVRAGGMHNHRADLGSGVLIKDNHIAAAGSVKAAVERTRERAPHGLRIEVEVDAVEQMREAIAAGADIVLLDNMSPTQVEAAAREAHESKVLVEVSGGITLETVRAYAEAGADVISVGAVTHSARSVDIGADAD